MLMFTDSIRDSKLSTGIKFHLFMSSFIFWFRGLTFCVYVPGYGSRFLLYGLRLEKGVFLIMVLGLGMTFNHALNWGHLSLYHVLNWSCLKSSPPAVYFSYCPNVHNVVTAFSSFVFFVMFSVFYTFVLCVMCNVAAFLARSALKMRFYLNVFIWLNKG